jgi:hypothetical protein
MKKILFLLLISQCVCGQQFSAYRYEKTLRNYFTGVKEHPYKGTIIVTDNQISVGGIYEDTYKVISKNRFRGVGKVQTYYTARSVRYSQEVNILLERSNSGEEFIVVEYRAPCVKYKFLLRR